MESTIALKAIAEAAIRASGSRNSLDRRIWTAISQVRLSISAHLNASSSAWASASSCSLIPGLASTSISMIILMYASQFGNLPRNASKSNVWFSVLIMTFVSSRKRCLSISIPVPPFITHSIDIFKVVRPWFVFPCAISAAKGVTECFIINATLSLRHESGTHGLIFPNREYNCNMRTTNRNFGRYFKGNSAISRYFNRLLNGHNMNIA